MYGNILLSSLVCLDFWNTERLCEGESSSSCSRETAIMASASSMSIYSARCIDCATVTLCKLAQAVQEQIGHLGDFTDIKSWIQQLIIFADMFVRPHIEDKAYIIWQDG